MHCYLASWHQSASSHYTSLGSIDVVALCLVSLSHHIKVLDDTLDSHKHISSICKSAFFHIWILHHIRSTITDDMAKVVASALMRG